MEQTELSGLQKKLLLSVVEAYRKYDSHAEKLSQARSLAQQHEFLCHVASQTACVKEYDDFKPSVFANNRNISKKFRDCAKGCMKNAPHLLQLEEYSVKTVKELRDYEAAATCFSQCVDTIYPDIKRAEGEIKSKYTTLLDEYPIE